MLEAANRLVQPLGIFTISAIICACSAPQLSDDVPAAYLADTHSYVMQSAVTGRTYQVSIALPRGYGASSVAYPVLYALDANGEFGIVVETARFLQLQNLVPELVVVGIGYPVGHYFDATGLRAKDLTPTEDLAYEAWVSRERPNQIAPDGTGGAPAFLQFLTDELIPSVESEYRVSTDRGLFGHSFGGLFSFYAMLHGEGAFRRFIIASPAFWWGDRVSFAHEAAYAEANRSLPARAFFSVGLLEPEDVPDAPWGEYISNLLEMVAVLEDRDYEGLEFTSETYPDELHTSVLPIAVTRGLRFIYSRE